MPVEKGEVEALKVGFPSFVRAPPPLRLPAFSVIWQGQKGGDGKSFFVDRESPKFTFSAENADPAVRNSANGRFTFVPRSCSSFSTEVYSSVWKASAAHSGKNGQVEISIHKNKYLNDFILY